jgi:hypothetical protein
MPIIGSLAGASSRALGGLRIFDAASSGDFESISSTQVTSTATTISFTSIPSTYKHLRIHAITRLDVNGPSGAPNVYANNYSGASDYINYYLLTQDQSSTAQPAFNGLASQMNFPLHTVGNGGTVQADYFSSSIIEILDYTNTNKYPVFRSQTGFWNGAGSGTESQSRLNLSVFLKKEAINRIDFTHTPGFMPKTRIDLYGIKG